MALTAARLTALPDRKCLFRLSAPIPYDELIDRPMTSLLSPGAQVRARADR
jgi:hypothetical protein